MIQWQTTTTRKKISVPLGDFDEISLPLLVSRRVFGFLVGEVAGERTGEATVDCGVRHV